MLRRPSSPGEAKTELLDGLPSMGQCGTRGKLVRKLQYEVREGREAREAGVRSLMDPGRMPGSLYFAVGEEGLWLIE